jgi:hypothetical protein
VVFRYRSTRELELQATRVIVAWAFDGQPMPGFEEVEQVPGIGGSDMQVGM